MKHSLGHRSSQGFLCTTWAPNRLTIEGPVRNTRAARAANTGNELAVGVSKFVPPKQVKLELELHQLDLSVIGVACSSRAPYSVAASKQGPQQASMPALTLYY
jgi:hypothetical protein